MAWSPVVGVVPWQAVHRRVRTRISHRAEEEEDFTALRPCPCTSCPPHSVTSSSRRTSEVAEVAATSAADVEVAEGVGAEEAGGEAVAAVMAG